MSRQRCSGHAPVECPIVFEIISTLIGLAAIITAAARSFGYGAPAIICRQPSCGVVALDSHMSSFMKPFSREAGSSAGLM